MFSGLFSYSTGYSFSVSFDASFSSLWPLSFGMSQSHLWAFSVSKFNPIMISSSYMAWNDIYKFAVTKCFSLSTPDFFVSPTLSTHGYLIKFNLARMKFFFHFHSVPLHFSATQLKSSSPFSSSSNSSTSSTALSPKSILNPTMSHLHCYGSRHHNNFFFRLLRYPSIWFHCFHSACLSLPSSLFFTKQQESP